MAVGGLIAGAAGGFYVASSTYEADTEDRALGLTAEATRAEPSVEGAILTETPTPVAETSEATATPTTDWLGESMLVAGGTWANARRAVGTVQAYVGGVECGSTFSSSFYVLEILSATERAGCGVPGAEVQFTLDGRPFGQTAIWQSGIGGYPEGLSLRIGPVFAQYSGTFAYPSPNESWSYAVEPLIDGVVCGIDISSQQGDGVYGWHVVVDPEELHPGCGRSGVTVHFRLTVTLRETGTSEVAPIAFPSAAWQPGPIVKLPFVGTPVPTATPES